MTTLEIRVQPYTIPVDKDGDVVEKNVNMCLDLWSCESFGFSKLTETTTILGSKHRTIEGSGRRDITSKYRTWEVSYEYLPANRYPEVAKFLDLVCDENYCVELRVQSHCGDHIECQSYKDTEWVPVFMDTGERDWGLFGGYNDFSITFEESTSTHCQNCGGN